MTATVQPQLDRALVPTDNIAALDSLDPQTREVAITSALEQANSWLAHVDVATSAVEDIANFKAYVATVAEASRRLKVSRECQMHAEVVVRRSERALGLSIRAGQERGEVRSKGQGGGWGSRSSSSRDDKEDRRVSPSILFNHNEEASQVYALTDDVTDDEFDEALDRAQSEENVSRRNVVRKVREVKSGAEAQESKWGRVSDMAGRGYTSAQIARDVAMSENGLREAARAKGIDFPADRTVGTVRRLNVRRVIETTVDQLDSIAATFPTLISPDAIRAAGISREEAQEWADSLAASVKALSKAIRTIRESIS